jgi:hypothetical protein
MATAFSTPLPAAAAPSAFSLSGRPAAAVAAPTGTGTVVVPAAIASAVATTATAASYASHRTLRPIRCSHSRSSSRCCCCRKRAARRSCRLLVRPLSMRADARKSGAGAAAVTTGGGTQKARSPITRCASSLLRLSADGCAHLLLCLFCSCRWVVRAMRRERNRSAFACEEGTHGNRVMVAGFKVDRGITFFPALPTSPLLCTSLPLHTLSPLSRRPIPSAAARECRTRRRTQQRG